MQKMVLGIVLGSLSLGSSLRGMAPADVQFDTETVTISPEQHEVLKRLSLVFNGVSPVHLKHAGINVQAFKDIIAHLDEIEKSPSSVFIGKETGSREYFAIVDAASKLEINQILTAEVIRLSVAGDLWQLELLLNKNPAAVDGVDEEGETALIKAASLSYGRRVVEKLLQAGALLTAIDRNGKTPLMRASEGDHTAVVEELLANFPPLDSVDAQGRTALMAACCSQRGDYALTPKILIERGANQTIQDNNGMTALMLAVQAGHNFIVSMLCRAHGVDQVINAKDTSGKTALFWAAAGGHKECFDYLVGKGANESLKDAKRRTPFMIACKRGHMSIVTSSKNPDLDQRDIHGRRAFIFAARSGNTELVKLFMNGTAQDRQNLADTDNKERTALMWAAYKGRTDVVRLFIEAKDDIHRYDTEGYTALSLAALGGHSDVVTLLLQSKAMVDCQDNTGGTPLFSASSTGHTAVVDLLIKAKASVCHADDKGDTPLSLAACKGHTEVVKRLVHAGAPLNFQDKEGRTALMRACESKHKDVISVLLDAGARVDLKDKQGNTALSLSKGHTEIEELIRKGPKNTWLSMPRMLATVIVCCVGYAFYAKYYQTKGIESNGAQDQVLLTQVA